jgi:hypothetical protein
VKLSYAIVFVADMSRSVAFYRDTLYRDTLGIPVKLESGVRCAQEPRSTFGARIAQYLDPDGMPISVSEPAIAR